MELDVDRSVAHAATADSLNAVPSGAGGSSAMTVAASTRDSAGGGSSASATAMGAPVVGDTAKGAAGGAAAGPASSSSCDGFAVLAANCASSGCHGEGSNLENFAASEKAARAFIDKP